MKIYNKTIADIILATDHAFKTLANKEIAQSQSNYLRNKFIFIGIKKPVLLQLQKELLKKFPITSETHLIDVIHQLWQKDEREYHYLACAFAQKYHRVWTPAIFELFEMMVRTKSWWDTVDTISPNLLGKISSKYPELKPNFDSWICDDYFWIRRAALLYQLKYKHATDHEKLFEYCKKTMHEKEFFIKKAIGWVLREYSKTNPNHVAQFITENKDALSTLSIKEGSKYI